MTTETQQWAAEVLAKIECKMQQVSQRNAGKIPYIVEQGHYNDFSNRIHWWTNGFFAGSLWQLYQVEKRLDYRQQAEAIECQLDRAFSEFTGLHHDVGFMWLHTAVANYRLTGTQLSKVRGLHAAALLAGRFHPTGNFLQAWNGSEALGWTIIDSMMNLPLLYWAAEETNNPRFQDIAQRHADTVGRYLVRADGSVGHIASFDPVTGDFVEMLGGQGFSADSAWTRGQAWAIYGFVLSYRYTKEVRFLNTAKAIANYYIANVSQSHYLSAADFKAPKPQEKYDASAGLCAACGLLELIIWLPKEEQTMYQGAAIELLRATITHWVDFDPAVDGLVTHSSQSYHQDAETHASLVYGDYFLIEGILRLLKNECLLW